MVSFTVNAEVREDMGKGASRRLRRTGMFPAVVYGGNQASSSLSLKHSDMLRHLDDEAFYSHVLDLIVDGKGEKVLLKDVQRHPYKAMLLHIDFLRIDESKPITMYVPLHFINTEACLGVKKHGGVLSLLEKHVEITCLPKDLPSHIEVDVIDLDMSESVHLSELTLPEGISISALDGMGDDHSRNQALVTVRKPKGVGIDDEEDDTGDSVSSSSES